MACDIARYGALRRRVSHEVASGFGAFAGFLALATAAYLNGRFAVADLGHFTNAAWNTLHGDLAFSSVKGHSALAEHFGPLWLLALPLFAAWRSAWAILVFQAVLWGITAAGVSRLAHDLGSRGAWRTLWVLCFCAHPVVVGNVLWGFNEIDAALPILTWLSVFVVRKRWGVVAALACVGWLAKEEMPLVAIGVAALVALRTRRLAPPAALACASLAAFILVVRFVMPMLGGGRSYALTTRYSHLGTGLAEAVATVLAHPSAAIAPPGAAAKVCDLVLLLLPLGFLPLRRPSWLLGAAPTALYLWLMNIRFVFSGGYHYSIPLVPFLFASAMSGSPMPSGRARVAFALGLCASGLLLVRAIVPAVFMPVANVASVRRAVAQVPANVSVCTDNQTGVFLAWRRSLRLFPVRDSRPAGPPVVYVLNLRVIHNVRFGYLSAPALRDAVLALDRQDGYRRSFEEAGVVIYALGSSPPVGPPLTADEITVERPPHYSVREAVLTWLRRPSTAQGSHGAPLLP